MKTFWGAYLVCTFALIVRVIYLGLCSRYPALITYLSGDFIMSLIGLILGNDSVFYWWAYFFRSSPWARF